MRQFLWGIIQPSWQSKILASFRSPSSVYRRSRDFPYRYIQKYGRPAVVFTEPTMSREYAMAPPDCRRFSFDESQRPIVAQITTTQIFQQTATILCELGTMASISTWAAQPKMKCWCRAALIEARTWLEAIRAAKDGCCWLTVNRQQV